MGVVHNLIFGGGTSLPTTLNVMVSGGTVTSVTASLGSRSVSLAYVPGPSRLPSGYTELEYIESTGTQYIDTGINGTACYGFELVFKPKETTQYESILSGVLDNATLGYYASAAATYLRHRGSEIFINGTVLSDSFNTITLQNNTIKINGTTKANVTTTNAWATSSGNIILCNNTSLSRYAKLYCKSLILYGQDQTTKLCNFIPARRNSDSVLGMYDLVNNTFHTNAGSGTFVAGPEVGTPGYWSATLPKNATGNWTVTATDGSKTVSDLIAISGPGIWSMELKLSPLPSGYTELEYIGFSGNNSNTNGQFIDTQVTPGANKAFYLDMYITKGATGSSSYPNGKTLFDARTSGSMIFYYSEDESGAFTFSNTSRDVWFIDYKKNQLGNKNNSQSFSSPSKYATLNFILGAWIENGTYYYRITGNVYNCKIYDNDTLVRDFVPARRNSDSVLGMYDTVTQTFYTNAGSGSFVAGPDA